MGESRNEYNNSVKSMKEIDHSEDLGIDGGNRTSETWVGGVDWIHPAQDRNR
jgi:hypothetical protein